MDALRGTCWQESAAGRTPVCRMPWGVREPPGTGRGLRVVSERNDAAGAARPASLILIEQSGVKHEIPQLSAVMGMAGAEQAMRRHGLHLREVKVVSQHRAIARWKAAGAGWRRVV
jgi:hypothetical protein